MFELILERIMGPHDYLTRHEKSGNLGRRRSKDKSLSCAHVRYIQRQHRHKQWSVLGQVSKEDKTGGDIREGHCCVTRLFLRKHNTQSTPPSYGAHDRQKNGYHQRGRGQVDSSICQSRVLQGDQIWNLKPWNHLRLATKNCVSG